MSKDPRLERSPDTGFVYGESSSEEEVPVVRTNRRAMIDLTEAKVLELKAQMKRERQ